MSLPSKLSVFRQQVAYQNRVFWRTPVAAFFTLALPLVMLLLFNALFDGEVETDDGTVDIRNFYTAGLAAFAAVSATFTNLANVVPIRRDEGILKRWRGTPVPPSMYVAGMIGSAVVIAVIGVVLMMTLGVVLYGVELDAAKLPGAVLTFVVGVACFAALGMAVASLIPSAESAPAVANALILPLAFVSDVFIIADDMPQWLTVVGNIFPLKHFVQSFQNTFNPWVDAPGIRWGSLGVLVLWGVLGTVVALRNFKWEPVIGKATSRRGRKSRGAAEGTAA